MSWRYWCLENVSYSISCAFSSSRVVWGSVEKNFSPVSWRVKCSSNTGPFTWHLPHVKTTVYRGDEKDLIWCRVYELLRNFLFFFLLVAIAHWGLEQLQDKTKTDLADMILEFYNLGLSTWQHRIRTMFSLQLLQINILTKAYWRKRKSPDPVHSPLPCSAAPLSTDTSPHNTGVQWQQIRIKLTGKIGGINLPLRPFSLFFLS